MSNETCRPAQCAVSPSSHLNRPWLNAQGRATVHYPGHASDRVAADPDIIKA
jgi:hypothetical protein